MIYIVGENLTAAKLHKELLVCAERSEVVGLDTETEGINPKKQAAASGHGQIACWSISTPKYEQVFLWADQLKHFKPWLESTAPKCGHNIFGFDKHMFANHGIVLRGVVGDTLRLSRLLYSCKMRSHGLKDLARNWLNIQQPKMSTLFLRPKHEMIMQVPSRKKAGVVEHPQYRETKRKVGEHKGVPTLLAKGMIGKFGIATEFIPLSKIPEMYPDRLEALYSYATLDALITRKLYAEFTAELRKVEWNVQK